MMKYFPFAIFSFCFLVFHSCKPSLTEYAAKWSEEVKQKIIEDASQQPDRTIFDSARYDVALFKGDKKLKFFHLKPKMNDSGKITFDTVVSIFYSADQNFELVRELCPVVDRSFEGIRYKGSHLGLFELKYCNGKIKETGFRFNGDIGIWKEYDPKGKIVKEIDHGNVERLEKLKTISYYR